MRLLLPVLLLIVAAAQVSVAPLFPVRAAIPDFALLALVALAVFRGPLMVMVSLPILAIILGFVSDREPGLLVLAYLPLLPLAYWLEDAAILLSSGPRVAVATIATGIFARTLLAVGAMAQGADVAVSVLVSQLLVPGLLLDLLLFMFLYFPFRAVGWAPRRMSPARTGF